MQDLVCPVCKSKDLEIFQHGIFDSEETNVIECNNCKMRFLDKIMTPNEEEAFYADYYKSQKARQFKESSIKNFQERTYLEYMKDEEFFVNLLKDKKDILEIGCGSGGFLKFIKEHFNDKKICTVEISDSNLEFLRDTSKNNFQDIEIYKNISDVKNRKFDFICTFGVLEHNRDSRQFLREQVELLKDKNSILLAGIPNKDSTIGTFLNLEEFRKFEHMKMHYYVFSEKSLEILADELGLYVEQFKYRQIWGLDNALSWLINKKPHDFSYFTKVLSEETLNSFRKDMEKNKTTDALIVIFKKK